jgi:hypothetical protein
VLIEPNSFLYSYPITRDFGFAPNPFHGICTLATCKPKIRKSAKVGDWVMGVGGCNLTSVKRKCIYLMKVTEKISFQEYWDDGRFALKKPARNGSSVQMLGDNIYHKDPAGNWIQEDSHHSLSDGSVNEVNLNRDTGSTDQVLVSEYFFYFGEEAVPVDLISIGYKRIRDCKKTSLDDFDAAQALIASIVNTNRNNRNFIVADPCQFADSHLRVDQKTGKFS